MIKQPEDSGWGERMLVWTSSKKLSVAGSTTELVRSTSERVREEEGLPKIIIDDDRGNSELWP